jgi:hypothetical protein
VRDWAGVEGGRGREIGGRMMGEERMMMIDRQVDREEDS